MKEVIIASAVRTASRQSPARNPPHHAPRRSRRRRHQRSARPHPATRPLRDRRRHPRLRHARSRAGNERRPRRQLPRRSPRHHLRHDHQPLLRLRPAVHRTCSRPHSWRQRRRHRRRRHREHVLRALRRQQDLRQPVAGRQLPRLLHVDGPHRRARREALRHLPRTDGPVLLRNPPEGPRRNRSPENSTTRSFP